MTKTRKLVYTVEMGSLGLKVAEPLREFLKPHFVLVLEHLSVWEFSWPADLTESVILHRSLVFPKLTLTHLHLSFFLHACCFSLCV